MSIIVQKYGGSSVANKEKLGYVIDKISHQVEKKNKVVVVVSAQGKTTDNLVKLAGEYCEKTYTKEMDLLLSTGELQTVALLTMMLKERGYDAIGLTGGQAGIITDSNFSNAKIKMVMRENIDKYLQSGKIVIVAGFQGVDKFGNITTLGRGGSDLSAVAIAVSLKAKKCEIYTDVDGVFSADPNVIHNAKLIKDISYEEMLEAASAGAKVLHNRAVSLAKKYKMELKVKNTMNNEEGTKIKVNEKEVAEKYIPKILAVQNNLSKITLVGEQLLSNSNIITQIYQIAEENNIVIQMISFSEVAISIVVKQEDSQKLSNLLHEGLINKE